MSDLNAGKLKTLRVVVSLALFVPCTVIFLDLWHLIPAAVSDVVVSVQLIPSLLKGIATGGIAAASFLILAMVTLAFGRIYCSSLCPLGTYQDIINRMRHTIHPRERFTYRKPFYILHYLLLTITGVLAFAGSMMLVNALEPFSNFGRILTNLFQPVIITLNNGISWLLGYVAVYSFFHIPHRDISIGAFAFSVLFLSVLTYLSYRHGRLFCNTLCPAGAFLGLISRISVWKIRINHAECNTCGACGKVCKAECIDDRRESIEHAACINCFNCLTICPHGALTYSPAFELPSAGSSRYRPDRRKFFREMTIPLGGAVVHSVLSDTSGNRREAYTAAKRIPVSPPGSGDIRTYSSLCTACHLCVSVCPTRVLCPSFLDYGIGGLFQPKMDYDSGYCNYDCTRCGEICPTGAIAVVSGEFKKEIQIGKAVFVREDCVVVAKKKDCAACSEHCPTKAVRTVPYEGKLSIPELNNDLCVGCGACEYACPVTPVKAIYVVSNPVHRRAKKPTVKKQEETYDPSRAFPF